MTLQRMDDVLIVVEDLRQPRRSSPSSAWSSRARRRTRGRGWIRWSGLENVGADLAMMRTPDGHGRVELTRLDTPPAVRPEPASAPVNTLGMRRTMFAVEDLDDVVARLLRHGAELAGEIAHYEDVYRLCFVRGPEGTIVGLAERLS